MDWISVAVAALGGAVGGLIGGLIGAPFQSRNVKSIFAVVCVVGAAQLARLFVTPWAEVEYLFRYPTPEIQALAQLAPEHAGELRSALLEAYRKGGASADFQNAAYVWGRRYAARPLTALMASRNPSIALEAFTRYLSVFKAVYAHNPATCYDWIEGIGTPTNQQLGIGPAELATLQKLISDRSLLYKPENAPLRGQKLSPSLAKLVVAQVQKKWDSSRLDFPDTAKPSLTLTPEKKANVCYTTFALFSEIQALPPDQRLQYLRGMFGAS